jgi:hypothetical protein
VRMRRAGPWESEAARRPSGETEGCNTPPSNPIRFRATPFHSVASGLGEGGGNSIGRACGLESQPVAKRGGFPGVGVRFALPCHRLRLKSDHPKAPPFGCTKRAPAWRPAAAQHGRRELVPFLFRQHSQDALAAPPGIPRRGDRHCSGQNRKNARRKAPG